jgi:arylsulfatase A-like enzyme
MDGIFLLVDPRRSYAGQRVEGMTILDIAPTVLELAGVPAPLEMEGRPLSEGARGRS